MKESYATNYTHKIVHSSAMYYQIWIVIHGSSKKLLTIKSENLTLNTKYV